MLALLAMAALGMSAAGQPSTADGGDDCKTRLAIRPVDRRILTADDLIQLTDIGSVTDLGDEPPFTVSPDARTIAVTVHRGNTATNSYCSGLFVIPLEGAAHLADSGPNLLRWAYPNLLGKGDFQTGVARVITPRWSPDGTRIAYLKPVDGIAQLWMTGRDGAGPHALTQLPGGVSDFRFDGDVVRLQTIDTATATALEQESLHGFHYDDRMVPVNANRPFPKGPNARHDLIIDPRSDSLGNEADQNGDHDQTSTQTWQAVLLDTPDDRGRIAASRPGYAMKTCPGALCTQISGKPWMSADGQSVYFVRDEGWADSLNAIYRWRVGDTAPRRLYQTPDLLLNCANVREDVVCAREGSLRPRYLDRIDLSTGQSHVVFDPNPDFIGLTLQQAERLHWRNAFGIPSFGDLVYPAGFQRGRRYPLIIVQYSSQGFLRGGTGNEFPIQLFAAHGYLVLSVQNPASPGHYLRHLSGRAAARYDLEGFRGRRNILSSIETEVRRLIGQGLVDPRRIGLTGLSDGSSTVQFALLHSRLFSAASAVGCCWEPSQAWLLGPAIMREYRRNGWPAKSNGSPAFWRQMSLAKNAWQVRTPLLINAADDEYLGSLESITALQNAGVPADLYIFPNEYHIKWQPAHLLAIYQRNLDWFDFWLRGLEPSHAPDHDQETVTWKTMHARQPHG